MSSDNFHIVTSPDHFKDLLSVDLKRVSLIYFWAPWAEPCKEMNKVVTEFAQKYPELLVLQVEAEDQEDISESFHIESVPSTIVLRGHTLLGQVCGVDAESVAKLVNMHLGKGPQLVQPSGHTIKNEGLDEALVERMRVIMQQSPVVLFMKGEPDNPRCGFSRKAVSLLRDRKVTFTHFDILEDEDVRQGLKILNNWPTYPQFIVNGELVGGLDVVNEMVANGEFVDVFGPKGETL